MERHHAIEDARIYDRSPADPSFACTWPDQRLGQYRLQQFHHRRTRRLDGCAAKLGSERHWPDTSADARAVVYLPIERWHAGNRFKRYPRSDRHWPHAGAHAGSIWLGAERIQRLDRISTTVRLWNVRDVRPRHDHWRHAANCGGSERAENRVRKRVLLKQIPIGLMHPRSLPASW
jgi:hypothetical protein